ncbi:YbaB/EbfC family nucleoid-associated protein [Amycolatopsis jiangsuensis]|uniref:DNA-binding protein YbaB n=1 Tax=Amycolatopsis jiangsuensis TaxID=1181879 RepID=A0A840INV2_9PSEU|nr:YbaB/EbfC family nucleoid-associated protein [Amycolatopsis jiangsuensis]MBB4684046.1 DNA-binding protein YbaB [Amycolatopsis jiangsuensis]
MTEPENEPTETAEQMKSRLGKIKENPELALFSEFKGTSRGGGVTVSVDLLGRFKRIHLAPGVLYEGGEQWLTDEIAVATTAAQKSATALDFDVAELAAELNDAPALKARVEDIAEERQAGQARRPPQNDDDWFDGFNPLG